MSVRIVIAVDLPSDDPVDAYGMLYRLMGYVPEIEGWESTDEWFGADGMPLSRPVVEQARMTVFEREAEESDDGKSRP